MADTRTLERRLGIAPGATLTALAELAEQVAPSAPWDAFAPLWLIMPWLRKRARPSASWTGGVTPANVLTFATTGGDWNHVGFLLDGDLPTDERPIVLVAPGDGSASIVAPNLAAFLGLVAVAFAEVVSRDATDAEWAGFRKGWYGDDPERLAEMERLSDLLCTIPGVERPKRPSRVANAVPDQDFELSDAEEGVSDAGLDGLRDAVSAARDRALALGDGMLDGRMLAGAELARAKEEVTTALVAALRALADRDAAAAREAVAAWREEPTLFRALSCGLAGDVEAHLAPFTGASRARAKRR